MQQSPDKDPEDPLEFCTPLTSLQPFHNRKPHLTDDEKDPYWEDLPDSSLVHYSEEEWTKVQNWSISPTDVHIGPSVFSYTMANQILGLGKWLHNPEIDAVMYLFRENTHLRRWKPDRVVFMSCLFSAQIRSAYHKLLVDKRKFKLDSWLLEYGKRELPLYGRNKNGNHWISLCITFSLRTIEVFDCLGGKYIKEMEAFAVIIPRTVKAVQTTANKKQQKVAQYGVSYLPMKLGINSSCGDCGVFSLKHIECHLFGMDLSLMDDENILAARYKMAIDLFMAAYDPVLIGRRALYTPPQHNVSDVVDIV
ncbi:hypothetical protein N665_0077s0021 [Sinapis alba]|nr:hypothetical protein N665_0077s0021 [Sinapis alba]